MSLLLLVWAANAASVTVESHPDAVVVFGDRARVTRTAEVSLAAGRQEVVFENLPTALMTDGITADARGGAILRGIDLKAVTATEAADRRVQQIEAELEKLAVERQSWVDEATAAQAEVQALLRARSEAARQLSAQMLVTNDVARQATGLRTSISTEDTAARAAVQAAEARRARVDEKIAALQRERDTLGSSATDTWTAVVHLEVERAGTVKVDLSYLVGDASWTPRYDVRGDADSGKVEVALSALVQQNSGEDWSDVKLTVSSARPSLGTVVPTLDPFWLQRYAPPPPPMMAPAPRAAMAKSEDAAPMEEAAPPPVPMVVAQAVVDTQLAATTFSVERREDVPADGTQRKVLLTSQKLDATLRYVVVPRLDQRVYLVGELVNSADFPLLAGTAGVFLTGSYLGDMQMETVAPGEKFDVAFGVDDGVTVRRVPRDIQGGRQALVGKRATSRWDWEVRIRNSHRVPVHLVVQEQVPVSTRDDVNVRLRPGTTVPEAKDEGLLDFSLTVPGGAETSLKWGYEVDYPSDLALGWME